MNCHSIQQSRPYDFPIKLKLDYTSTDEEMLARNHAKPMVLNI